VLPPHSLTLCTVHSHTHILHCTLHTRDGHLQLLFCSHFAILQLSLPPLTLCYAYSRFGLTQLVSRTLRCALTLCTLTIWVKHCAPMLCTLTTCGKHCALTLCTLTIRVKHCAPTLCTLEISVKHCGNTRFAKQFELYFAQGPSFWQPPLTCSCLKHLIIHPWLFVWFKIAVYS